MTSCVADSMHLKECFSNSAWAVRFIWSTNRRLTVGLALATLARGFVPAGLALFARGLINVFVTDHGIASVRMEQMVPWVIFGFGVTILEAVAPLAAKFCTERLHDEVNLKVTSEILHHAEKLEPAFFEDSGK